MAGREVPMRSEPGFSLPAFERLAPPPPPELVAARIEEYSSLGDVVIDLHGRGGWIARAAVDRQRRAASLETSPLTRLLAEVVLRPPDVRHLDAAFQAISAAPREQSALKVWLGEQFASRCATCGRSVVARRDRLGERPRRPGHDPSTSTTAARSAVTRSAVATSATARSTMPTSRGSRRPTRAARPGGRCATGSRRSTATTRSSSSSSTCIRRGSCGPPAILERIEGDLRRHPSRRRCGSRCSMRCCRHRRLNGYPGRIANLRISGGRIRLPAGGQWRERNPWLAFEDGFRLVRGFVQRLEGAPLGADDRHGSAKTSGASPRGWPTSWSGSARRRRSARSSPRPTRLARLPNRPPRSGSSSASRPSVRTSERLVLRLLRDRLGPRPGRGVAAAARGALRRLRPRAVGLAGGRHPAGARRRRAAPCPRRPGGPAARAGRSGGARRGRARRCRVRLSAGGCAIGRARRGDRRDGRVRATRRAGPGRATDPGQRRSAASSRAAPATRTSVPGRGLFAPPERFDRGPFVRGRRRADRDRHHRRDPPGARRTGPLRAAARGDPGRPRSSRSAPAPRRDARWSRRWGRHRRARRPDRSLARRRRPGGC